MKIRKIEPTGFQKGRSAANVEFNHCLSMTIENVTLLLKAIQTGQVETDGQYFVGEFETYNAGGYTKLRLNQEVL